VALLAAVLLPSSLFGWGAEGHQIVGEIAWHCLSPDTKRAVRELLPAGRYATLARAGTWADSYARGRSAYEWAVPLHYINVDIDEPRAVASEANCPGGDCVVRAIERFSRQLRDPEVGEGKRVNALRFLAHFVADVHQPLHVAHADDCGGCSVKPLYRGERARTIHKIWDTTLIREYVDAYEADDGRPDPEAWWELADDLRSEIRRKDAKRWSRDLTPLAWADESLALAKDGMFAYRSGDRLPAEYSEKAYPAVTARLKRAGVRLAALLDVIFSDEPLPF
jgi:hypothetical protein